MNRGAPVAVVLSGVQRTARTYRGLNDIAWAIARSLGRRGVRVYQFHPNRLSIELTSRYCTHVCCPNLYEDEAGLVEALVSFARSQDERPALFPALDGAAQFLARHEEPLGQHFALVCASRATVAAVQDKQRLLEHACRLSVPIPATHFPKRLEDVEHIARSLAYPAVIKPLTSEHWKSDEVVKTIGSVKAVVVRGPEELLEIYRRVAPLAPEMMMQEIIPGETDRLLTFLGYIGKDGAALAGCVRKKLRQYPSGFGYCTLTETVKDSEVMALAIHLLCSLGYRGIGCVEFKRDPRDGRPKLIEINARPVRTTGAAIGAGVDLPWIAYQDRTSSRPPTPVFQYTIPMRWIHLRGEIRAAASLMRKRELSFWRWLGIFRGRIVLADWAWDDLRPSVENLMWPMLEAMRGAARSLGQRWRASWKSARPWQAMFSNKTAPAARMRSQCQTVDGTCANSAGEIL